MQQEFETPEESISKHLRKKRLEKISEQEKFHLCNEKIAEAIVDLQKSDWSNPKYFNNWIKSNSEKKLLVWLQVDGRGSLCAIPMDSLFNNTQKKFSLKNWIWVSIYKIKFLIGNKIKEVLNEIIRRN